MKVFISWSKDVSQQLAIALRDWLPEVIQEVSPWMSSMDIGKGERWSDTIATELADTNQGLICVTRENQYEAWLNFEAGALAKTLPDAKVRPILLGVQPHEVIGPLAQFQATRIEDEEDVRKLVASLNAECSKPLEYERLERSFARTWSSFAGSLTTISTTDRKEDSGDQRAVDDMVKELLGITRSIQRGLTSSQSVEHSAAALAGDSDLEVSEEALRHGRELARKLELGMLVDHEVFGSGVVEQLINGPAGPEVVVALHHGGRKRLFLPIAHQKLTPIF